MVLEAEKPAHADAPPKKGAASLRLGLAVRGGRRESGRGRNRASRNRRSRSRAGRSLAAGAAPPLARWPRPIWAARAAGKPDRPRADVGTACDGSPDGGAGGNTFRPVAIHTQM